MKKTKSEIDIQEGILRCRGNLLDILLSDKTTNQNIIWGTDTYREYGDEFEPQKNIHTKLVTGKYNLLIQPRAAKSQKEQRHRTKDKGEVFTPLNIIAKINRLLSRSKIDDKNWQNYVRELKLEIACGEAPFIVTRYNPISEGKLIKIKDRVGFLDQKLKIVSQFCHSKKIWIHWAKEAYKASYGYEWQGDNLLLARENLLYSFVDYYQEKFGKKPEIGTQEEVAEIISWNIFQMDGLRYVVPMSCRKHARVIFSKATLFGNEQSHIEEIECEGCKKGILYLHNGIYVKIMNWDLNKPILFTDLLFKPLQFVGSTIIRTQNSIYNETIQK